MRTKFLTEVAIALLITTATAVATSIGGTTGRDALIVLAAALISLTLIAHAVVSQRRYQRSARKTIT